MKKIITAAIALTMIAALFAGCSDGLAEKNTATTNPTTATEEATEAKTAADYSDTYEGLRDYMQDKGYIKIEDKESNVTEMQADLIGAEKGYRYTMNTIKVELYAFNLKKNNKTRNGIIASVKNGGKFTLYSKDVTAYLSDNGKYLMIYTDTAIGTNDTSSDAYKLQQKAIKDFKSFKK